MPKTFVSVPLDASVVLCFADLRPGTRTKLHVAHAGTVSELGGKSAPVEKLLSNAVDSFFDGWEDGNFCVYGAIVCGTAYSIAVSGGGENGPCKVSYVKAFVSPIQ